MMEGAPSLRKFARCSIQNHANSISCKGYVRFDSLENTCNEFCKKMGYTCYEAYKETDNDASCLVEKDNEIECSWPPNDDFVCGCEKGKDIIVRKSIHYS